jgi:hypothetical protein
MMTQNKLKVWEVKVPGDFGINFSTPIWCDNLNLTDEDMKELEVFVEKNYDKIKFQANTEKSNYMPWNSYNIFNEVNLEKLKQKIVKSYYEFVDCYGVERKSELWINGWINVIEHGIDIPSHNHAIHTNSYLSGFINFTENDSTTDMYIPLIDRLKEVEPIKISNDVGNLTLFPSWLFHSVDCVKEDVRISMGFDLHTKESYEYAKINCFNSLITKAVKLI